MSNLLGNDSVFTVNGYPDAENLTLEKLQKTLDDWKARDPRGFAEIQLLAAVKNLSVAQIDMIARAARVGAFSFDPTSFKVTTAEPQSAECDVNKGV